MKVSIIVPIYNVEKYISHCIESIKKQTFDSFECILVNDGTKDNSIEVAKVAIGNDERFKILHKENGGLSDARNFGLKHAQGEYVFFLDSDDSIDENTLKETYEMAKKYDSDITCFDIMYVYENGKKEVEKCAVKEVASFKDDKNLIFNNNSACNKFYKRTFLEGKEFIKGMWYEDLAVIPAWMAIANNVSYVDKPFYLYLQREGSISHSADPRIFDIYKALLNIQKLLNCESDYIARLYYENALIMTTLRIREISNTETRKEYYAKNVDYLNEHFKNWYDFSLKNASSFKQKILFTLLKLKMITILDWVY